MAGLNHADARSIADELDRARRRTLGLLDPLSDDEQRAQHSPLMSPPVWDLAHVGNYEDIWLRRAIAGADPARDAEAEAELDRTYDAFANPRADRPTLDLLGPIEARRYLGRVREEALALLEAADLDGDAGLTRSGFVYGMVVQHEHQHDETLLATLQLGGLAMTPTASFAGPRPIESPDEGDVLIRGGSFHLGADPLRTPWALDNERPAHPRRVAPFRLDVHPVTNRRYLEFIEAGGYDEPAWWSNEGWDWRISEQATGPLFWSRSNGAWEVRRFDRVVALDLAEPVQHVSWYEADAFARWSGARLPTEIEWEFAAATSPAGDQRVMPWGDEDHDPPPANLGQRHAGPSPVGAYPDGVSGWGLHDLVGNVWEWTSSDFTPYAGFEAYPYREYSEVFWGTDHKVLRGGSWATDPTAIRCSFRNWDFPVRRQIFAGFRCAYDIAAD